MNPLRLDRKPASAAEQFIRYLMAGGIGAAVEVVLFGLLAWKVFPALRADEWAVRFFNLDIPSLAPGQRALNFAVCLTITFLVSNLAGYLMNVRWVFVPGRHSRRKEITLFYIAALLSYSIGSLLGSGMIAFLKTTATIAYLATASVSILINYVSRKFFVFQN